MELGALCAQRHQMLGVLRLVCFLGGKDIIPLTEIRSEDFMTIPIEPRKIGEVALVPVYLTWNITYLSSRK